MPQAGNDLTPLAAKLIRRIEADGPISVADFMAACLTDPEHGYYTQHDPLGRAGDFITAPEISQIFGELIGIWCLAVWQEMGSPEHFVLAELGPGRGTLMADALRAASLRPAFGKAASVALVEVNEGLRRAQRSALEGLAEPVWVSRPDELPDGPLIVVANEFFDALPIRQFVRTKEGWGQRMVGIDEHGALAFGLRPLSLPGDLPQPTGVGEGAIYEASPAATAIVADLADRIVREGGAMLAIDYGHAGPGIGDTLQAVRNHAFADPLAEPGLADLTAHVDFAALARAAAGAGASVRPLVDQATFLGNMGIGIRATTLASGQDDAAGKAIASAVERLTGADQMGQLFKVIAFSSEGLSLPAFDTV